MNQSTVSQKGSLAFAVLLTMGQGRGQRGSGDNPKISGGLAAADCDAHK